MPRVRCHRRGKQNPPASGAQTETPRNSSRLENSPGIRSEIVPLPLGAPSRPPQVAGRDTSYGAPWDNGISLSRTLASITNYEGVSYWVSPSNLAPLQLV